MNLRMQRLPETKMTDVLSRNGDHDWIWYQWRVHWSFFVTMSMSLDKKCSPRQLRLLLSYDLQNYCLYEVNSAVIERARATYLTYNRLTLNSPSEKCKSTLILHFYYRCIQVLSQCLHQPRSLRIATRGWKSKCPTFCITWLHGRWHRITRVTRWRWKPTWHPFFWILCP